MKGYSSGSKNLTHNVDDNVVDNTTEIVVKLLPFIHNIVGCSATFPCPHPRPPTLANDDMIKQSPEKKASGSSASELHIYTFSLFHT